MIQYIPNKKEVVQVVAKSTGKKVYLAKVKSVQPLNGGHWKVEAIVYPEKKVVSFFSSTVNFVPVEQR